MSKEIYISTTPHETRLAIVEDEQLSEIYYERENEYTLAGSIYNGKVTRVLPGMQSSFVDIGLERDAFLYVTDFMEEQGDAADFETDGGSPRRSAGRESGRETSRESSRDAGRESGRDGGREESSRESGSRGARDRGRRARCETPEPTQETASFDEPIAPTPVEESAASYDNQAALDEQGSRRWRGRRGRRRGRAGRETSEGAQTADAGQHEATQVAEGETVILEGSSDDEEFQESSLGAEGEITIDLDGSAEDENLGRRNVHRPGRMGRPGSEERAARQQQQSEERSGRQQDERGGRRREGRGRDERRGFGGSDADFDAVAVGEAVTVLPGESIRKYRDPAAVAEEDAQRKASAPAPVEMVASSRASFDVVGWDGGAMLPGETLSRHRKPAPRSADRGAGTARSQHESTEATAPQPVVTEHKVDPTPVPDAVPEIAAAAAPEETGGLTQHPAHGDEDASVSPAIPDVDAIVAAAEEDAPTPSAGEYEPTEGEGASLGEHSRRDLRRMEQRPEPVSKPEVEAHQEQQADVAQGESDAPSSGEVADLELASAEAHANAAEQEHTQLIADSARDSDTPAAAAEHEFTSIQPDGAMLSGPVLTSEAEQPEAVDPNTSAHAQELSDETPAELSGAEPVSQVHAYGDGDFHEEELDGDEYEYDVAVSAIDEEDFDDYEEETLDGAEDLGAVLLEMSGDERAHPDEDDEELEVAPDTGGFTVEDFGGEPGEDPDAEEEGTPAAPVAGAERRGRRDGRRSGRDRDRGPRGERAFRGGAGADRGRGRSRQSVQTMDLPAITDLLKPGQEVLVQIAKEPIAKKGARITSHIALPGRFLVFMPTVNHTGVSRKISSDEERRRLKSILLSEKGEAQGGFIVRTAAEGASEEELRNDLRFLIQLWQDIKMRSEASKSPALIYHDLGLIERILRDQVTDNFSAIWVDSEQEYERVLRFLQRFQPSLVRRVKLYSKETPLFEHFGITAEIDKALKSKVWLKSGGSIVINQTEALVAIDINTGKYVGKTARLEDTILKTNLDAIPEIVRQIRLRDLGGIIVIDFIDMDERKNRAKVMQALEDELRSDRAPSKVLPFNDFGLVIMTRKRVKQSLERTLCVPDPITEGTGMIKSPITVSNEIYVEMRKMHRHMEKPDILLRVHPEVVKQLKSNGARRLQELEEMTHKTILLKSDPALSPEQFDIH